MKSIDVVKSWIERFNSAEIAGLSDLYDEQAINHQVVMEPLLGRAAIFLSRVEWISRPDDKRDRTG
jgi:hypothetical protein